MDASAILEALPHRHPMLLVDRVVSVEPGKRLVAIKCVTIDEPVFAGHFPGRPIFPGVLIVEAMAQAAGLLAGSSGMAGGPNKVMLLLGIDRARFRRPVVPGDRMEIEVRTLQQRGSVFKLAGTARVDGQVAAEAELLVATRDQAPAR
ncbi:MAG: 3-hydroxyacyl-ACP dehydratase FabZ [Deltaproteobacteria bacterium]|nr:3-hydroxyacyl-ACP dehydratase FabZ [Deltaproteobacteria bacterium]